MTSELMDLTWVIALTAIMWVPYIVNSVMVQGLVDAVGYPDNPKPLAPWAQRMKKLQIIDLSEHQQISKEYEALKERARAK